MEGDDRYTVRLKSKMKNECVASSYLIKKQKVIICDYIHTRMYKVLKNLEDQK